MILGIYAFSSLSTQVEMGALLRDLREKKLAAPAWH